MLTPRALARIALDTTNFTPDDFLTIDADLAAALGIVLVENSTDNIELTASELAGFAIANLQVCGEIPIHV